MTLGRVVRAAAVSVVLLAVLVVASLFPRTSTAVGPPAFVQQAHVEQLVVGTAGLTVVPGANVTTGNRLVVQVEMWNYGSPTAASVAE